MDFSFGKKEDRGISVVIENSSTYIYIPDYILFQVNNIKLKNWTHEIKGTFISKGKILISNDILPSDIYYSYYHFIE